MTVEYRTHEFCRICRRVQKFETLRALSSFHSGVPDFRVCAICGSGYSIDKETA